ncbi:MAG: histidine--tRNA ligase [Deltaproteobacteria bacterium]|nr:histidine--tRNA ligase [Deltaproteobacteria bacterium]
MATVQNARGTRDLLPAQMHGRLHVIGVIREVFASFGFEPLETPAFERIETLMGKYGEEGEKLIFRILERGEGGREGKADLALRYDLTVPLARVIAQNPAIPMPFKRYQVQPVWRADRPQKGRFREFYQCDADIVGIDSRLADAECLAVAHEALSRLGFADFQVRVNHRKLLSAICAAAGAADREAEVLVAIDKLDKIGRDGVSKELAERAFAPEVIDRLWTILAQPADLDAVEAAVGAGAGAPAAELRELFAHVANLVPGSPRIVFDATLARGLGYYTGPVFEAVILEGGVGSVSGGGRYDGLVGMFSGRQVPAVGVSLGLERLLVVLEERGMLPTGGTRTRVLVTRFSPDTDAAALRVASRLRAEGIETETWLGAPGGLGKQFKYAAGRGIPLAVVVGPEELEAGAVSLKDLRSGHQSRVASELLHGTICAALDCKGA